MASEKVTQLVDLVKELTVLELSELVSELEEEFGVTAAAPVAAVAAAPVAGGEEADGGAEEKSEFDVVLKNAGASKINVIKIVRDITGLGLKEAKGLVDEAPGTVKEAVPAEEAEKMKKELEEAGAEVELQ